MTTVLGKVYRVTRDIPVKDSIDPDFTRFLDSRLKLHTQRGFFAAFSAIIISGFLLAIIYVSILYQTRFAASEFDAGRLIIQVILLLQIMNKGRSFLGGIGSISSLYPQIKMAREIDEALTLSSSKGQARDAKKSHQMYRRLPFFCTRSAMAA